jgi:hypothetical protein
MPFRSFEYCAKLYDKYVTANEFDIYGSRLIKIPAPQCYVFYNGTNEHPDREEIRLSEAFEVPAYGYEWTVIMLNINKGHNQELLEKCQALKEYSDLVGLVREYQKEYALDEAVDKAVKELISRRGVLSKMLDEHRSEVVDLCITEYNEELHEKNLREEGRAEGREEGREEGRALAEAKILINMYKNGFTVEQIASATNKEVYEVKDIIQK